ncbi:MAG: hypothetical protein AMXMBFR72_11490 [Betaproteobacteria bacterium]
MLAAESLAKTFTLHQRGSAELAVFRGLDLQVAAGECVALAGGSGCGKSSLLRCLYGNYAPTAGAVRVRHGGAWVELSAAAPRTVLEVRRHTLGYVSQFLRAIPRVAALDVVAEPLRRLGVPVGEARARAGHWLARLNVPERLWALPPATFSGGEQQRVNIARGLIAAQPIVLLDEPTAALDAENRRIVVALIRALRERGGAIVGIFHDDEVRRALATRELDVARFHA